ncbi:MAG: hypothetical protein MK066_13515, partial [Crocinitomicaceae bacterium]|nr:hypothetical protein [Crocinitomicaceae bacterium]
MNELNINKIDSLYNRYGYELKKSLSNKNVRIFTLNKGVYFGADIVVLNEEFNSQKIHKEMSDAGYACRLKSFSNISDAENYLFDSFFHSSQLSSRLQKKYGQFKTTQT